MIWDQQKETDSRCTAWTRYLEEEMAAFPPHLMDRQTSGEVARAVAGYCGDRACVRRDEWVALVGRALWGIGQSQAAAHYLQQHPSRRVRDTLLYLLAISAVSPALWNLVVRGILVRYPSWLEQGADMWRLDLRRLWSSDVVMMDLVAQAILKSSIQAMAGVWDADRGAGLMGIRTAFPRHSSSRMIPSDWYLIKCLEKVASERRWSQIPRLIHL